VLVVKKPVEQPEEPVKQPVEQPEEPVEQPEEQEILHRQDQDHLQITEEIMRIHE
jgi:hypothetical protein